MFSIKLAGQEVQIFLYFCSFSWYFLHYSCSPDDVASLALLSHSILKKNPQVKIFFCPFVLIPRTYCQSDGELGSSSLHTRSQSRLTASVSLALLYKYRNNIRCKTHTPICIVFQSISSKFDLIDSPETSVIYFDFGFAFQLVITGKLDW